MATTVMIVDDSEVVRDAVTDLLAADAAFEVVGTAGDAASAAALATGVSPDVAIVDVRMPGGGPAATAAIRRASPRTRVVAYSAHEDREGVLAMVAAGAMAYLSKGTPARELKSAIADVVAGQSRFSPAPATAVLDELGVRLRVAQTWGEWAEARRRRVHDVLDQPTLLDIALQPVIELRGRSQAGAEALSRFPPEDGVRRGPDEWFTDAWDAGLGVSLELLAIRRALRLLDRAGGWLSINVSPETLLDDVLPGLIAPVAERVVLELTEHTPVDDYAPVQRRAAELRGAGARLAIDDVGAGFASLRHIVSLRPQHLKLDRSLTHGVENDPARRTLTRGLVAFARELDATVVAEGIETERQLEIMAELGVDHGQGYYLGRPEILPAVETEESTHA